MSSTAVARTRAELAAARAGLNGTVAVVMTMGALHAGHIELVRQARKHADAVIMTIFLNPLQFGPGEDLAKYPRTFDADLKLCIEESVDLVFAPSPDVMYPDGDPGIRVTAGLLGNRLEGAARPGHFDGVLTVVAKLLHLTRADLAFFGQKDAQQLLMIRRMVQDLDYACEIVAVPTVREADALALSQALAAGEAASAEGASAVRRAAREVLVREPLALVDYLVLVHPETLEDVPEWYRGEAVLLVAARIGRTRLIDNVALTIGLTEDRPGDRAETPGAEG